MDVEEARRVLESNDHGKRLLVAESALCLIRNGKLPELERIVAKALFVARAITDKQQFRDANVEDMKQAKELMRASEPTAYLMIDLLAIPQATLFYHRDNDVFERQVFGSYFTQLIELIYGVVGLDVRCVARLDKDSLEDLLRTGLPSGRAS